MGFFGKIKNILFEDDDEVEEMPVYTKEEVKETSKKNVEEKNTSEEVEPIKPSEHYRFSNVKRDIDLNYDEKDVLGEVPGAREAINSENKNVEESKPKEEKKSSIFMSFDEEEFERLNSRVVRNENKVKKEVKSIATPVNSNIARKVNNNFSSTSTNRDTRMEKNDRYKINSGTLGNGKKPFTPSPVISPVYGILGSNYTKEDIIDRKDGLKRETIVKPIVKVKKEEVNVEIEEKEPVYEVDIDSVRKKAYGSLEDLEKTLTKADIPELKEEKVEKVSEKAVKEEAEIKEAEDVEVIEPEKISVEDQLDEKFEISNAIEEDLNNSNDNDDLDQVVEKVIETKKVDSADSSKKPKLLDELEKTSTLQILDDIEKELNSIKPISKDVKVEDDEDNEKEENNDTLEDDLFNLIDSMYEEGEEEEND